MKRLVTKTEEKEKRNLNLLCLAIAVVFISKYVFEAGVAVGKMFYRLVQ